MTENGYYEGDVCLICGQVFTVSFFGKHRAILVHVVDKHLIFKNKEWHNENFKCWCGFMPDELGQNGTRSKMINHLANHTKDANMTFPTSVELLWAHYHAAMIGVNPENKCDTSTEKR